jgi:hypothetical protein
MALFSNAHGPLTDSSESTGAQRVADEHGRPAVRSCAIENSGERLHSLESRRWPLRHLENHVLLIFGALIVLMAVVIIPSMRLPGSGNGSALGWISEQWLAEHRAAHSA